MAFATVASGKLCFADNAAASRVSPATLESVEPTTNTSNKLPGMVASIARAVAAD
jgi:hypothetical protein